MKDAFYTCVCIYVFVCIPSFLYKVDAFLLQIIQYYMTFVNS